MPITTPICMGVAMGMTKNPPLFKSLDPLERWRLTDRIFNFFIFYFNFENLRMRSTYIYRGFSWCRSSYRVLEAVELGLLS